MALKVVGGLFQNRRILSTNYINKSERGVSKLMKNAMLEMKGNMDLKRQLKTLGNVFMNASEISAREAAYSVLKLSMSRSSNQDVYINTRPWHERVRILKNGSDLNKLDDDDCDIFRKNLIDHYVVRPDQLEQLCLAEFAAFYTFVTKTNDASSKKNQLVLEDDSGFLTERTKPKVLIFKNYGLQQDPVNFYRQQLMLYANWRNEQTDLIDVDQEQLYVALFDQIKENRSIFDVLDSKVIDDALVQAEKRLDEIIVDGEDDQDKVFDPEFLPFFNDDNLLIPDVIDDNDDRSKKNKSFPTPFQFDDEEYSILVSTLNEKQYEYLTHVLNKTKTGCSFYEIISGGVGVGKSRLIQVIYQSLLRHFNSIPGNDPNTIKVLLTAPTGKASFNIMGTTLHSVFALPVNQYSGPLIPLSIDVVNSLHTKLIDLKLMVIDEFSMVGARMFNHINARLQQIFKSKSDFAEISVILVGDLRQLPPVGDRWIFMPSSDNAYAEICGRRLWEKFSFFELTEIMRQRDDKNNMASGEMTEDDVELFKSREIERIVDNLAPITMHLFRSNNDVDAYNSAKLDQFVTKRAVSVAEDVVKGSCNEETKVKLSKQAKNLKKAECFGMMMNVVLQIDAQYMVSVNLNVENGLVNGATGVVREIDMHQDGCKSVFTKRSQTSNFSPKCSEG